MYYIAAILRFLTLLLVGLPVTFGYPASDGELAPRAAQKFNQYASMEDCKNDRNILYHKAPRSFECVKIDPKTDVFFFNTGGLWNAQAFISDDCSASKAEGWDKVMYYNTPSDHCQPVLTAAVGRVRSFKMN
ncbi:hypothetical protein F5B20DRAFT_553362 [Whalleya microplaca]|nr:hypothetical protein F5B20DRAFT_553362 [Whalleya microplaca]